MLLIADYFYYDVLNDYPEFGGWHQAISAKYTHGYLSGVHICRNDLDDPFIMCFESDRLVFCAFHVGSKSGPYIEWTHIGELIGLSVTRFYRTKMHLYHMSNSYHRHMPNSYQILYEMRNFCYRCVYLGHNHSIIMGNIQ